MNADDRKCDVVQDLVRVTIEEFVERPRFNYTFSK